MKSMSNQFSPRRSDDNLTPQRPRRRAPSASKPARKPRTVGIDRGMSIPASFFEPLPQHLIDAFRGDADPA